MLCSGLVIHTREIARKIFHTFLAVSESDRKIFKKITWNSEGHISGVVSSVAVSEDDGIRTPIDLERTSIITQPAS